MELKRIFNRSNTPFVSSIFFLLLGLLLILLTYNGPIGDFGNYYYGSKLLLDGKFSPDIYTGLHYFNQEVAQYGEKNFFGNYIPVPPLTALVYIPFCVFDPVTAKLLFNLAGLLLFCFSFYRFVLRYPELNQSVLVLPFIFLFPLFQNIVQGQSYLYLLSLLVYAFIEAHNNKVRGPGFCLALSIGLKLFPVFLLLYFVIQKKYRLVAWTLLFTALLFYVIPCLFIGYQTSNHYVMSIIPRLANNEVIGAFYVGNQSIYTVLLHLFSYEPLHNPLPILNSQLILVATDGLLATLIIFSAANAAKNNGLRGFSVFLIANILLVRYNTTYALVLLVPLAVWLCISYQGILRSALLGLLLVSCSISFFRFNGVFMPLQFIRLAGILVAFTFLVATNKLLTGRLVWYLVVFGILFLFRHFSFPVKHIRYFSVQNSAGILYHASPEGDTIALHSTLGMRDTIEHVATGGKIRQDPLLLVKQNQIWYKGRILTSSHDNKADPFIYNDTCVVFLSDLNQALGFFKLRIVSLNE